MESGLLMILSMALSQYIYIKIDKKYKITDKISVKIPVKKKWKGLSMFFCVILIGLIMWWFDVPETIYFIITGILMGIILPMISYINGIK